MSNRRTLIAAWLLISAALSALVGAAGTVGGARAAEPLVVASIRPVHSLVAMVMAEGQPVLLYSGAESPHEAALRPSQARTLQAADLIVRVAADFETALRRPLRAMAAGGTILTLSQVPGIIRLPRRGAGGTDPHIWLDARNAAAMVRAIADALVALDPQNARNAEAIGARAERAAAVLGRLDAEIAGRLAAKRPFVASHDAFQYLEARYGLRTIGALAGADGARLGARGNLALRRRAGAARITCLLSDGPRPGRPARALAADLGARLASFDVLGSSLEPGPGLYPKLMRQGVAALTACLGAP
ncbi:MAG TPA: zinc ABC transporter substrate-binding protein [Alphaproteobacteria bacterium]|jgi:zinc transport system substrate-binding protein|nr:zinc ABC transporter substrate-binding protein [Alphaproteobacteria bacterium]MDP6271358.1 zinc ABC transporter substrate-binding protein [Alphaproteobacteria bacterium]MDP7163951.1 zinc ABC transporter substrate-binding protein [Alphaproteobacteria bacterium]MDP7429257.1 zinc ABC transporter substrate-binding protein [Alphaproteobacteria bacterium]HJM48863.1 zinc ABC transporter substrate-binding protein [Alphaproteobacteria bacterium]